MTSRVFFYSSILISVILALLIVLLNVGLNDYGVFGDVTGRKIKIYSYLGAERLSKHLFSYNYIPLNFEGIILGSSVSDNLNPKLFKNFKIYNASLNGGNISELKVIVDNVLKYNKKVRFIIICIDPYITKDSGKKTSYLDAREYRGSLGSLDTLKHYISKVMVYTGVLPDYFNEYGYFNFNIDKVGINSEKVIRDAVRHSTHNMRIEIDGVALKDFQYVVDKARIYGLRVFAYYYPRPRELYLLNKQAFSQYQTIINSTFSPEDCVWDFNDDNYQDFTADYASYSDGAHLSDKGADYLLNEIEKKLLCLF